VLLWLRAQVPPCPWDDNVCSDTAEKGHLEVLQWARAQGAQKVMGNDIDGVIDSEVESD